MRWLYCDYVEVGRCPSSAMFYCTDEALGFSRAGVAKLNEVRNWSCDFRDFSFDDVVYPIGKHAERDSVMVVAFFDEGVCINHPTTGEPVLPPVMFSAICKAAYEGDVMKAFAKLFESRGWVGEMSSTRIFQ